MPERFEEIFATKEIQPQFSCVESMERVMADERRIIHAEYTGGLAQSLIEEAMIAAFYERAERFLGYDPFTKKETDPSALALLARSEGLEPGYETLRECGVAAVKRRVALIVEREGLDLRLAVRDGLRAALGKKHDSEVKKERSAKR